MAAPAHVPADDALLRFLEAHRLLRRIASGRAFRARVGAPGGAVRRRSGTNVLELGGYYQLGVRRCRGELLEIGVLHGRRPDLRDARFLPTTTRVLSSMGDVRATCSALHRLTAG